MRKQLILMTLLLCAAFSASARVNVSIGIHVPIFPRLVQVPSYPVYYAPDLNSNYFFYDGEYWVYEDDGWYSSSWYDGPWEYVEPEFVPSFVLRVPVRYYRLPPRYFVGWYRDAPPRWHDHWGYQWAERRRGWDHWDRRSIPVAAPLPIYQRQYAGNRYPRHREQQHVVRNRHYDYRPRDAVVRNHNYQPRREQSRRDLPQRERYSRTQEQRVTQDARQLRTRHQDRQNDSQWDRRRNDPPRQLMPPQQDAQRMERRERRGEPSQPMAAPERRQYRQSQPTEQRSLPREQRAPNAHRSNDVNPYERGRDGNRGHDRNRGNDRGRGDERGRDRN